MIDMIDMMTTITSQRPFDANVDACVHADAHADVNVDADATLTPTPTPTSVNIVSSTNEYVAISGAGLLFQGNCT